jgi:RNA polymerase sigma-70 factor (ECF subfamily)
MDEVAQVALLGRIASQDRNAFEAFYRLYEQRLYWYLLTRVKQHESAEELVIEVMMAVWQGAASQFQGKSKVSGWLFGIARNKAIDHVRRMHPQDAVRESEEVLVTLPASGERPDEALFQAERQRIFQQCFEGLSPEHSEVLQLALEGTPYQEIAEIAFCPLNTVKTRVFNGKRRLQECLERHGLSFASL